MQTVEQTPDSVYLMAPYNRAVWRALGRGARIEVRREYRLMRKGYRLSPQSAAGFINRLLAVTTWDH